jgi:hypothetical protein
MALGRKQVFVPAGALNLRQAFVPRPDWEPQVVLQQAPASAPELALHSVRDRSRVFDLVGKPGSSACYRAQHSAPFLEKGWYSALGHTQVFVLASDSVWVWHWAWPLEPRREPVSRFSRDWAPTLLPERALPSSRGWVWESGLHSAQGLPQSFVPERKPSFAPSEAQPRDTLLRRWPAIDALLSF